MKLLYTLLGNLLFSLENRAIIDVLHYASSDKSPINEEGLSAESNRLVIL